MKASAADVEPYVPQRYKGTYSLRCIKAELYGEAQNRMGLSYEVIEGKPFEDGTSTIGTQFTVFIRLDPENIDSDKGAAFVKRQRDAAFTAHGVKTKAGQFDTEDFTGTEVRARVVTKTDEQYGTQTNIQEYIV